MASGGSRVPPFPLPPIPFSVGRGVDSPRFRVSSPRSWLPLLVRLLTVQGLLLISLNSTHFYSWRPQFALAFDPDIPYAPRDVFVLCLSNAFLLFGILHQYALFIASSGFDQCTWWIEWANGPLPITICPLSQSSTIFTAGSGIKLLWDAVCEWHVRETGDVFCCFSVFYQCPDGLVAIGLGVSFLTLSMASVTHFSV